MLQGTVAVSQVALEPWILLSTVSVSSGENGSSNGLRDVRITRLMDAEHADGEGAMGRSRDRYRGFLPKALGRSGSIRLPIEIAR